MRHVSLTCKNHPHLRWSTKEIAFSDSHGYNGCRNIFFKGEITQDPPLLYPDKSGVVCETYFKDREHPCVSECSCPASDLVRAPEDKEIASD